MKSILILLICLLSLMIIILSFKIDKRRIVSNNYYGTNLKNKIFLSSNSNSNSNDSNDNDKNWGRPEIIPFDDKKSFAREDIRIIKDMEKANKEKEKETKIPKDYGEMNKVKESKWEKKNDNIDNTNRGTGYNLWNKEDEEDQLEELEKRLLLKKENEDEDDNWLPSRDEDITNPIVRFFKSVLIDSPYDSRRKKQAKYVVRNITGFSVAIGIIFTGIFYAFPGKFISYRGDTDFTVRYQQSYIDPTNLLNEQFPNSDGSIYFDDAIGLPIKDPNERVPYEKPNQVLAPSPSQSL